MDTARLRTLLDQRDALDAEIVGLVTGEKKSRKPQACSVCGSSDHTARTCPTKGEE